jgi:hypothetical protein
MTVDSQSDENDREGERGDGAKNAEGEIGGRRPRTVKAKPEEGRRGRLSPRKELTRRKRVQALRQ